MIKSFKHKGLKQFHETGNTAGILTSHKQKLRIRLTALDTATGIEDIDLPGCRLHLLKGGRKGLWAIDVSKNWRIVFKIVFKFEKGNAFSVDYKDYH
jgi:proteic killer suppression protein